MRALLLLGASVIAVWAQPQPSEAARQQLLQKVSGLARGYLQRLPDFICLRVTEHFTRKTGNGEWKRQVKIAEELTWYQHHEHYRVVAVNDVPKNKVPRMVAWSGLVTTAGNFGEIIEELFAPESGAGFQWTGTEALRGATAWVFSYRVPSGYVAKSCRGLIVPVCKTTNYPYSGSVYVSPDTAAILRITVKPEGARPEDAGARSIDYGHVSIGGTDYLLPVADTYEQTFGRTEIRNEALYRDYRKFAAESTMK